MRTLATFLFVLLVTTGLANPASAQFVSGRIVDQTNQPLVGVRVELVIDGTSTLTDGNGEYVLAATSGVPEVGVEGTTWGALKARTDRETPRRKLSPKGTATIVDTVVVNGDDGVPCWSARVPLPDGNQTVNAMLADDAISYLEFYQIHDLQFPQGGLSVWFNRGNDDPNTAFPLKFEIRPSAPEPADIRQHLAEFEAAMGRDYFVEVPDFDPSIIGEGGWIASGSNTTPRTTYEIAGLPLPPEYQLYTTPNRTILYFQMGVNNGGAQTIYHEATRMVGIRGTTPNTNRDSIMNPEGATIIYPQDVALINWTHDLNQFDLNNQTISIVPLWAEYGQ